VTSAARSNISARIERIISNIPPASPPRRWVRAAAVVGLIPLFVLAAATAQTPAGGSGPASDEDDPNRPRMIDMGQPSDANYPVEAKRLGVEGWAIVNATIDESGNVTYVQILEISPADSSYGFAEAATHLAKTARFSNPTREPRQVKFKVKFALADKHGGAAPNLDSPRPAGP
jgi:TonB family protein